MQSWKDSVTGLKPWATSACGKIKLFNLDENNLYRLPVTVLQTECECEEDLCNSIEDWSLHNCPHISECLGYHRETRQAGGFFTYLVMPQVPKNLQIEIEDRERTIPKFFFPEEQLVKYLLDLMHTLSVLQQRGVGYRDVRLQTILLEESMEIRLVHFSYAVRSEMRHDPFFSPAIRDAISCGATDLRRISHNPYKSEVFSLGATLLSLSALNPNALSGPLHSLNSTLHYQLSTLQGRYSDYWLSILASMLTLDESSRPDFSALNGLIENKPLFDDDEPIRAMDSRIFEPMTVSMRCGLKHIRVSKQMREHLPCMITLKGAQLAPGKRLLSVDLVCVVDVSGSMDDSRMSKIQHALVCLVDRMTESDRMSLIAFSDTAQRVCRLTAGTEEGKCILKEAIAKLKQGDLTNLLAGFFMALEVIERRHTTNSAVSMLLFTDGKDNRNEDVQTACLSALSRSKIDNLRIDCFGFGKDVDTALLQALAQTGSGCFYPIPETHSIESEFAKVFTRLTTEVASNIVVTLRTHSSVLVPCILKQVYSGDGTAEFSVDSLAANSQKDLVFTIESQYVAIQKPANFAPISAVATYKDFEGVESRKEVSMSVTFIPWQDASPPQDEAVFENWYHVRGCEALYSAQESAANGQIYSVIRTLGNAIELLMSSEYASRPMVKAVVEKLERAKRGEHRNGRLELLSEDLASRTER